MPSPMSQTTIAAYLYLIDVVINPDTPQGTREAATKILRDRRVGRRRPKPATGS